MMIVSARARFIVALCCLLLLVPIAGIPLQNEGAIEQLHYRTLAKWPKSAGALADPVPYFTQARNWVADRAYPIIAASMLSNKILYFVFHTPPQHRVTLGRDGFLFVNGHSDDAVNEMFDNLCIKPHSASARERLEHSFASFAKFAGVRGIAVDVVIVPTTATLYGDYLPASVPPAYLSACRQRAEGDSPLLQIPKPSGMHFIYPFAPMKAARDDEAFYPKANWHASGLSLKVVRDAYLSSLGVDGRVDEQLVRGASRSEILAGFGIASDRPVYFVRNEHVRSDPARLGVLVQAVADLYPHPSFAAHYYVNAQPVVPESVLMVSDSFGDLASEVFAGAFKSVFQVASSLPNERLPELVDRVARVDGIRRVILLVQEGGVDQIVAWGNAVAAH